MSGLPPITPWPPLITAAAQPRWMVWRDWLLTLSMWLLLALLCRHALLTLSAEILLLLGLRDEIPPLDFREHWRRMQPYWVAVGLLMLWLILWGSVWVLRRRLTRPAPMPRPLDTATEALRHEASAEALLTWRELPVAIVHVEHGGRMRAVPPGPERD
ncbi:hypothetical protein KTR66_10150 [Roseococcus sp. SDR]|uniref:hypothetical protein n=1 Tax=Roseococcus sp. SDR TaxID=2835532 RepID=UPI001BCAD2B2|nr:hypothetical protein [Roseococcus sp. SDR]MBS7790360.1 hypothetical protein [Roseococcus sp. SDR]MBV1845674.1 hypothetical protein [Roseococcus sp. SDR]